MSGLEVAGFAIGVVGLGFTLVNVAIKTRDRREHEELQLTSKSGPVETDLRITSGKTFSVEKIRDGLSTYAERNKLELDYNQAALQAMGYMYNAQILEARRFSFILTCFAFVLGVLTFILGYYMAENQALRKFNINLETDIGLPFEVKPAQTVNNTMPLPAPVFADDLLTMLTTFLYGALSGYLYLPLAALTLAATPFDIIYTVLAYPASFSWFPTLFTAAIRFAIAAVAVILVALANYEAYAKVSAQKPCNHDFNLPAEMLSMAVSALVLVFLSRSLEGFGFHPYVYFTLAGTFLLSAILERLKCERSYFVCQGSV